MRFVAVVVALLASLCRGQTEPPKIDPVKLEEVLAGRHVSLVLVKDFMAIENTGELVPEVEFERYVARVDEEQVILGRWAVARGEGGTEIPIEVAASNAGPGGNLIQTYRLKPLPPRHKVTVTLTTLVARRERPGPAGEFLIPKPEEYPEEVRPYLAATAMVAADHAEIKAEAEKILEKSRDAYQFAAEVARLSKTRTYLPAQGAPADLPTAVSVLRYGGSCCASAVCAAALLRAAGIPAQVTYAPPPSYIHGIVRFYLKGYGWVRMDATSGTGKLPLMQEDGDLSLVRVFDMPIEMEKMWFAYAWPYQHNDLKAEYAFVSGGEKCPQVRMRPDAPGALPFVNEPFPHLEPGSWSAVLGTRAVEGFGDWEALVKASAGALAEKRVGDFGIAGPELKGYVETAGKWGMPAARR